MLSVAGNSRWSLRLVDLSQIDDFYHLSKQKMHDKITVYTFPLVKAIAPLTLAKNWVNVVQMETPWFSETTDERMRKYTVIKKDNR